MSAELSLRVQAPPERAASERASPGAAATRALVDLCGYLARDGRPPLPWVVAHAPDGSLQRLWDACVDPGVLVDLMARVSPRVGLVAVRAVARACGRGVPGNPRPGSRGARQAPTYGTVAWRMMVLVRRQHLRPSATMGAVYALWCAAIRRDVPAAPTLADLVAAARAEPRR